MYAKLISPGLEAVSPAGGACLFIGLEPDGRCQDGIAPFILVCKTGGSPFPG